MQDFKINRIDLKAQTEKQLLLYIKSLDLKKSNKLPREEELSKELGVSRITLRAALSSLENTGIIFRRHGKGTFVNPLSDEIRISLTPALSFYYMIRESGLTPRSEQLSVEIHKANEEIANALQIEVGDDVLRFDKIFYADNKPCAYIIDYVRTDILKNLDNTEIYKESIFKLLDKEASIKISWDKIEIDTVLSTDYDFLEKFCRPDGSVSPMIMLKGINFSDSDIPVMLSYEYINTQIIKYNQIRKRESSYDLE